MTRATWRDPRWAATAPRRSDGRAPAGQGVVELSFGLAVERGLDDLAPVLRDPRQDLVRGALAHEHHERGAALVEPLAERLHELVVDARVGEGAGSAAGGRADRHAEQRGKEDQPDQAAPQGAAGGAGRGHVAGLVQLHLAVRSPLDDDEVVEDDRSLLRQLGELGRDGAGGVHVGVRDGDQIAHAGSVVRRRVRPDHPPGVIQRDPGAGDAGEMVRRAAVVFLLVLGCGLSAAALIAIWTRATVTDTDRYVETMAPVAASPAVQKTVADKLDKSITGAIDFEALARDVLPDRADVLAPAIEAGAESAIRRQLDNFVASDRFQDLWNDANRRAHSTVVGLLTTGKSGRLALKDETVYLDLSAVVDRIKERLHDRGYDRIADAIPDTVDGRIPLLTSDGFATARKGINLLKGLSIVLPILALLCFGGHLLLSRPRRRGWLRVALGLAVTSLLLLAAVGVTRSAYLDAVDQAVLPKQAASDIFDALISLLRTTLRLAVIIALVLAALSLLA